jgi:serine/threonine protein kinase
LARGAYNRRVALKFVAGRPAYERELARRGALGGAARCDAYLPLLGHYAGVGVGSDPLYAEESLLRGLPPFLLILPRADANLREALAGRPDAGPPAGRDWRAVRRLTASLLLALQPLHEAGLVHAALCPAHCVRVGDSLGGEWRLLAASSASSSARGEYISPPVPSAFAPPELCRLLPPPADVPGAEARVSLRLTPERSVTDAWEPGSLRADISYDMWALGAILFHAFTGAPLWPDAAGPPGAESLGQAELARLAAWDCVALDAALAPLGAAAAEVAAGSPSDAAACRGAAAMLRWLLQPTPSRRPASVYHLLGHSFLNPAGRMQQARAARRRKNAII